MNMPVPTAPQLPAHLMDFGGLANIGASAIGGINVGQSHPRISIKQNRFRLLDEQGQEYVVPALDLDIIVVGANDYVSKLYYAKAFDPADPEPPAPTCFSDNGVGPSERSTTPQCATCSGCPHAAWGSKVTPSGTKVKACSDSKKLAVVLANNANGAVYELRVPAASMENLKGVIDSLRGAPLPSIVLKLTFDANTSYPKLIFAPVSYITPEQKAAVLEVLNGEEVEEAVGKKDKVRDPNQPLIAQGAPMAVPPATAPIMQPAAQVAPSLPPQPQFTAPAYPVAPQPPQFAAQQPLAPAYNPMQAPEATQEAAAPAKRTRRTKAQIAAEQQAAFQPAQPVPQYAPAAPAFERPAPQFTTPQQPVAPAPAPAPAFELPPIPQFLQAATRDVPGAQTAAASVPLQPQPTDGALDAILGSAMVR
jgi:hypothetical protein